MAADNWRSYAKDSLLEREWRESRVIVKGDPKLAAAYIPLARKILGGLNNHLRLGGIDQGSRKVRLTDGTQITVLNTMGQRQIIIDARSGGVELWWLFLETGFIDLYRKGETGDIYRTYEGARLNYMARQRGMLDERPAWLDSDYEGSSNPYHRPYEAGQNGIKSLSFQGYESSSGGVTTFNLPRYDRHWPPHIGYATGKLKLYLQSLSGRVQNPAYRMTQENVEQDSLTPIIAALIDDILGDRWGDFRLAFGLTYSVGLYATQDYRYWLLTIDSGRLYARRLLLGEAAEHFREQLLTFRSSGNDAEDHRRKTQIEAYLLADCLELSSRIYDVGAIDPGGTIIGDPIHEGWKFNFSGWVNPEPGETDLHRRRGEAFDPLPGIEAQLVTDEFIWGVINNEDVVLYHILRRYKLELVYQEMTEPNHKPFSITLRKKEEVEATPEYVCWRPSRRGWGMDWYDWHGFCRKGYPAQKYFDAPLYCYYAMEADGSEHFTTVRYINLESIPVAESELAYQSLVYRAGARIGNSYYRGDTLPPSIMVCGHEGEFYQETDVEFKDHENRTQGYYIQSSATFVLDELSEAEKTYDVVHGIKAQPASEGRPMVSKRIYDDPPAQTWNASPNFGGWINLDFPSNARGCDFYPLDSSVVPEAAPGMAYLSVTAPHGETEVTYRYYRGDVRFKECLVFPWQDGESVFLQKERLDENIVTGLYKDESGYQCWHGTVYWTESSGNPPVEIDHLDIMSSIEGLTCGQRGGFSYVRDPLYHNPEWVQYNNGQYNSNWTEYFIEYINVMRLYVASSKECKELFSERNYQKDRWEVVYGWDGRVSYDDIGINAYLAYGKHATLMSPDPDYPFFDFDIWYISSYLGDSGCLKQFGPFEDGVPMPFSPIYTATDDELPIQNVKGEFLFTGWA